MKDEVDDLKFENFQSVEEVLKEKDRRYKNVRGRNC